MDRVSRRGAVLFAAMSLIWGVPYLLIRVAVRDFTPETVVFLRTAIGALLLLPWCLPALRAGGARHLSARWLPLLLYTTVEVALPWWLLTDAEEHLTSSLSGLIVAAVPLFGILINRLTGGVEPLHPTRIAGLAMGFAGVGALVGLQVGSVDAVAVVQVLLTALGYALGPIILARSLADLPGPLVVATSLVVPAIGYAPAGVATWPGRVTAAAAWSVTGLAVVCTALGFLVFFALIREIGPTRATVITFVNPAVALALGVALLGEPLTVGMAIGFPLVIAGSVLATRPVRVPQRAAAAGDGSAASLAATRAARSVR